MSYQCKHLGCRWTGKAKEPIYCTACAMVLTKRGWQEPKFTKALLRRAVKAALER